MRNCDCTIAMFIGVVRAGELTIFVKSAFDAQRGRRLGDAESVDFNVLQLLRRWM